MKSTRKPIVETTAIPGINPDDVIHVPVNVSLQADLTPLPPPPVKPDPKKYACMLQSLVLLNKKGTEELGGYAWADTLGRIERMTNAEATAWFALCDAQKLFPGQRIRVLPLAETPQEPSEVSPIIKVTDPLSPYARR